MWHMRGNLLKDLFHKMTITFYFHEMLRKEKQGWIKFLSIGTADACQSLNNLVKIHVIPEGITEYPVTMNNF